MPLREAEAFVLHDRHFSWECAARLLDHSVGRIAAGRHALLEGAPLGEAGEESTHKGVAGTVSINDASLFDGYNREGLNLAWSEGEGWFRALSEDHSPLTLLIDLFRLGNKLKSAKLVPNQQHRGCLQGQVQLREQLPHPGFQSGSQHKVAIP